MNHCETRGTRHMIQRLQRIKSRILEATTEEQFRANCANLARELDVTSKTIQRDIDFMIDQLGHRIEYVSTRYSYRYAEPPAPVL